MIAFKIYKQQQTKKQPETLTMETIPNAFSLARKTGLALLRSTNPGTRLALRARLANVIL